jgi:hypothetical protein
MPDITCARCRVKLRVADRVLGKTIKCPECGASFVVAAPAAEIVRPPAGKKPAPPAAEIVDIGAEFLVQEPPRPKPKRPADEYEIVEAPRPRRAVDDVDDVDEVDLIEDLSPEQAQQRKRAGEIKRARLGVFLNFIAACIQVGALGLTYLFAILAFSASKFDADLLALAAIPALGGWVVSAVGLGFCVTGPSRNGARGLAIAAAAVSGVHLILILVDAFQDHSVNLGVFGSHRGTHWDAMVSELPYLSFLTVGALGPGSFEIDAIALLNGLLELAQIILLLLLLRALAQTVKDHGLAGNALMNMILFPSALGVLLVLSMLWGLVLKHVSSLSGLKAILLLAISLIYLTWIGLWVWLLILLNGARHSIGPRREGDGPKPRRSR